MTTNQLGPLVAGRDEEKVTVASGPARDAARDPGVVPLEPRLLLGRAASEARSRTSSRRCWRSPSSSPAGRGTAPAGWRSSRSRCPGSPTSPRSPTTGTAGAARWGTATSWPCCRPSCSWCRRVGAWWVSAGSVVAAAVFLAPVLASPVAHSLRPGAHATRGAFRLLPAELTMLNDLSVFTETWRKKRPFGFVGNPRAASRPGRLLPLLPGRRHVRQGGVGGPGRLLAAGRRLGRGRAPGLRPRPGGSGRPARRPAGRSATR